MTQNKDINSLSSPLVRLRGLSKTYPEGERQRMVFQGLDADFGRGEMVALIGRSGSGKSTLLNLISGIDLPTAGEVTIGGTVLTGLSERERTLFRRRHIGFIFQFFNLIPTLTVLENLLLPLELKGKIGCRRPAAGDRSACTDRTRRSPRQLSGSPLRRRTATSGVRPGAGTPAAAAAGR